MMQTMRLTGVRHSARGDARFARKPRARSWLAGPSRWLFAALLAAMALLAIGCAGAPLTVATGESADFDYFRNSWSVVGLQDYLHAARLTPDNRLELRTADPAAGGAPRLLQPVCGASPLPIGREPVKRLLDGWLPIVVVTTTDGAVSYAWRFWATPLPGTGNWRKAFAGPIYGENFLVWISARATNHGLAPAPARALLLQTEGGPGEASAAAPLIDLDTRLKPNQTVEATACSPYWPDSDIPPTNPADANLWLDRTIAWWRARVLEDGARFETPCAKANEALRASLVYQLIGSDHGVPKGGEVFYDELYIRDGAYQIQQYEEAGLMEMARSGLDAFLANQRPDGRFETQQGQFDANGQAVWALWQYYAITGDRQWLEEVYPAMRRAADWTMQARRQAPGESPFAGVLPAAVADGEYLWDGTHHIVGYDLWNLRAIQTTARAAEALGLEEDARTLHDEAQDYRAAIDAVWGRVGTPWFPPSWEGKGTPWGNTEVIWPTPAIRRGDTRVRQTIRYAREVFGGGFREGTIRWIGHAEAIHPYMSAYTTMSLLDLGEHEKVVQDFYWYLVHSSASHAFPEGIYAESRTAWNDTIPHLTGASNYAILLRHMLVHESDQTLDLLKAIPDWWVEPGRTIRVTNAPTHFGNVSFTVRGEEQGVRLSLDAPNRARPERIRLYLPEGRRLLNPQPRLEVVPRFPQRERWTFEKTVALYESDAPPRVPTRPQGLVLPLAADRAPRETPPGTPDEPTSGSIFVPIDLRTVAITDPLVAPFGIDTMPRYRFHEMPVGVVEAAGIPFHIIDPAANNGRSLVVLHSPSIPDEQHWPNRAVVPVGLAARRLYVLGAVHGFAPRDPGVGADGAVAEIVVEYVDGQTQRLPYITGVTADDWASAPFAADTVIGLRGDPWHLNVVGLQIRPETIRRLHFVDLGTQAAPVLAAVTLEADASDPAARAAMALYEVFADSPRGTERSDDDAPTTPPAAPPSQPSNGPPGGAGEGAGSPRDAGELNGNTESIIIIRSKQEP